MIFLIIIMIASWLSIFGLTIQKDLEAFKPAARSIFRLHITDLWAIIVGLLPSIWVFSLVVKNWSPETSQNLGGLFWVFLTFVSQLLGMIRASLLIILPAQLQNPSRARRALSLILGALYGLVLMAISFVVTVLLAKNSGSFR